ncbi:hypothetical protein [Ruminiclostridium papyrosolvens]|uniref:Uncharacterized protein n=1 Tax=Ruminiclostridium papyrosolvens C7 TaxID=1330534 RepID=U4QZD9_9FIRM|nr:hypothetical protein [Ruminiclostridium papyrosolvens]EPR10239.1 hypothetical protein L323_14090 [Ruminiclostridium papyrosolvens C7]
MGKRKKEYEIVIFTPETNEQKMCFKNEIGRAYGEFIIQHLINLDIPNKQMSCIFRKIIKEIR